MKNNILEKNRKKIDEIDNQIICLLKKRFKSVEKIIVYRKKNGISIRDKNRELSVINKRIRDSKLSDKFIRKLFRLIINESKKNALI